MIASKTSRIRAALAATVIGGSILVSAAPASAAITSLSITPSPNPGVVGQPLVLTMSCTFPDGEGENNPVGYISFGSPLFFFDATETGSTTSGGNITFTFTRTVTPTEVATDVPIVGQCDTGPDTQEIDGTVDIVAEGSATTTTTTASTTTVPGATATTAPAAAGAELARTGTDAAPFILAGGTALVAGIGLVGAVRRRRTA
ncbi:MAG: hypothetical protein RL531_1092 [Actinomycetota bacterium]|jgi:LPXTG-motif cell wall-anchored protein